MAIIDTQSVKTTEAGGHERGYDGGKHVKGRKRHVLIDTLGLLLVVLVHSAAWSDNRGAKPVLTEAARRFPTLRKVLADGTYRGRLLDWVRQHCPFELEIRASTETMESETFEVDELYQNAARKFVVRRHREDIPDAKERPSHSDTSHCHAHRGNHHCHYHRPLGSGSALDRTITGYGARTG